MAGLSANRPPNPAINPSQTLANLLELASNGDLDAARRIARNFDGFVPATEPQWQQYHNLLETLGLPAQDEIMTARFLNQVPSTAKVRLHYAFILLKRRRRKESQAQADILMTQLVPSQEFLNQLSSLLWRLENWPQLLQLTKAGLEFHPSSFRMQYTMAVALFRLGRPGKASQAFATALDYAGKKITRCLEIAGFADRNNIPYLGAQAFERALQGADHHAPADWLDLISFLKIKYDQTRLDRFCETVAARVSDAAILTQSFDFAWLDASPAAASALGRCLQAVTPDSPDLDAKLKALNMRANLPYPSGDWWQVVKS